MATDTTKPLYKMDFKCLVGFLLVLANILSIRGEKLFGFVYMNGENNFEFQNAKTNEKSSPVAWGLFEDKVNITGWGFLEIWTNDNFTDSQQAYAAGFVEGQMTREFVKNNYLNQFANYCKGRDVYCQNLKSYLNKNLEFMNKIIAEKGNKPYWHQVSLVLQQIVGIDDGVKNVTGTPRTKIDVFDSMLMDLFGDLLDLDGALSDKPRAIGSGSCSALIKVLKGNKDIYFAHDTWYTYSSMLRINKKYTLRFKTHQGSNVTIPGHTVSFSSYPGNLASGDDFYLISTGLAVTETTNTNYNHTLSKQISPNSVFDFIRNVVANRLATSGREWTRLFSLYNSGTYNNQFMILDYKLFKPGKPLVKDLLWIVEQMPNYIVREDVTDVLRNQTYWSSYNTPYFKLIFNVSEYPTMVKKYGEYFDYDRAPRSRIFRRDHSKVVDLDSMTKLMRYNDFKNDPLSRCNCSPPYSAENAIAARSDLNHPNGNYPFDSLTYKSEGATDMKLTNYSMFKKYQFVAICGPTDENLPSFRWSTSGFKDPHYGQPDLFNFKPIVYTWNQS